jgi:adenylate kinase
MLLVQFVYGRSGVIKLTSFFLILTGCLLISNFTFSIKNFVLISAPGSGKGTFSQYLVKKYGYIQICPGDLFRGEIARGTKLGKKIQPIVERGEYVDENIVCSLIGKGITNAQDQAKGFILDGFPRSMVSFTFLDALLKERNLVDSTCFIQFLTSDTVCTQRIFHRLVCTNCFRVFNSLTEPPQQKDSCDTCDKSLSKRSADTLEIVKKRLQYFHDTIEHLMAQAATHYSTITIDGEDSIDSLKGHYETLLQE